jgi:hypothetical protein
MSPDLHGGAGPAPYFQVEEERDQADLHRRSQRRQTTGVIWVVGAGIVALAIVALVVF